MLNPSKMGVKVLFLIFLSLGFEAKCDFDDYKNVDDFLDMIVGNITASHSYVLPTDNSGMMNFSDSRLYDYGTFDFVIIGSGSAGAVLANRLSEISKWKVLLLEAGGDDNDFSDIPEMNQYLVNSRMNWGYNTTPQANLGLNESLQPQSESYPSGKVIGGTSTINGLVYARGNPEDFDNWHMSGWSYDEVLPYFLKSEDAKFKEREEKFHGEKGYLSVDVISETPGVHQAVVSAFQEVGLDYLDYNGQHQLGIGKTQYNHKYNQRASTARAFLDPIIRERANLKVSLNSFVTKLLINKMTKSIYGVEFVKHGKRFIVRAKKEVLLSAGAINSPQIMMLSGIGPKDHLKELSIDLVQDLPVGQNLCDQVVYSGMRFRTNHTYYNITYKKQVELFLENFRPLTGWSELIGFVKLDNTTQNRPDFEVIISVRVPSYEQYSNSTYTADLDCYHDINMILVLLHPNSRGSIKLKSNSALDMPLIDPNYLGDEYEQDIETFYQAMKYIMSLNDTETFRKYEAKFDHGPIEPCDSRYQRYSREWCYCAIRRGGSKGTHMLGTSSMGTSAKNSVVDATLKVHGVKKLRVVDAGIMPNSISGHTSATGIMIGEKASDLIKEEYLSVPPKKSSKDFGKNKNEIINKEWWL